MRRFSSLIPALLISPVLGAGIFLSPSPVSADEDLKCMHRAIDDRAEEMRDAYERYANDMNDTINRLSDTEHDAIDIDDYNYRQSGLARSMQEFSFQMNDMWNRLNMNLRYAWDNYYQRRAQCGFGAIPQGSYGGSPYNYNYGYPYNRYGNFPVYCSQPVLQPPPAGCGYECAPDSNGCQRCHLACRSAVSYTSCGCTTQYDPVCTRDGRTYDNACIAVCTGREVWYDGACR